MDMAGDVEIQSSKRFERARVIAILDASLALAMLILCSFAFTFISALNGEIPPSEVLVVMLAAPFALNAAQLMSAILLMCCTRKNTRHLNKCRTWCCVANFLSGIITIEFIALLFSFWEYRLLIVGLFGIELIIIRISVVDKVQAFLENLIKRNSPDSDILTNPTNPSSFTTRIQGASGNVTDPSTRADVSSRNGGPNTSVMGPPPSYNDAILNKQWPNGHGQRKESTSSSSEPPPNYSEFVRRNELEI